MTSNQEPTKKKQRGLWKGAMEVGKVISKPFVVGMNLTSDANEALCRSRILTFGRKHNVEAFAERHFFGYYCGRQAFYDAHTIFRFTDVASERSCQRGILELCALKMSGADRRKLLASHDFPCRGKLFRKLRYCGITQFNGTRLFLMAGVMKQKWFEETEAGQVRIACALYKIISSNPTAFSNMLSC